MKKHMIAAVTVLAIATSIVVLPSFAYAEGNAGTAIDGIYYDQDPNLDMHFAPLDKQAKTVKLAYAHLKESSSATPQNPIDFVVPSSIESNGVTYTVTAVGYDAKYATAENSDKGGGNTDLTDETQTKSGQYDKDCIKSVVIPETVGTLGSSCFGNWGISEVKFTGEPTINEFGYGIFRGCKNLRSVDIPASVTDISGLMVGPFNNSGLTSITIPKTVKTISSDAAFANCPELKDVVFEDGSQISELPSTTFSQSSNLESIKFGSNSELAALPTGKNASSAFLGNKTNLKTIDFGENNSIEIGNCAFWGCTALENILNAGSVSNVGSSAFRLCSSLKSVQFKESRGIGKNAFFGCTSLESVEIGGRCSSLGDNCFNTCGALSTLSIGYSGDAFTFGANVFVTSDSNALIDHLDMHFYGNVDSIVGDALKSVALPLKSADVYGRSPAVMSYFKTLADNPPNTYAINQPMSLEYHQLPSFADPDVNIGIAPSVEYTGEALVPALDISVGAGDTAKTLKADEDYQLVYSDNIKIGTATVEIQGMGETYAYDSRKVTFEIVEPVAVTDAKAKIAAIGEVTSLDQQAAVEAARAAYDAITNEAQKALIGDEQVDVLKAAETQVKILGLEKQIADANDASVVGSLANQLAAAQAELDAVQTELGKTKADAEAAAAAAKADLDAAQAKISSAKADQKLKVAKAQKTKTVKAKKAKKKAVKTSKVKVSGAKTKLTYAKVSGSEKLSISTSGKIKVKKGTKKGTYKIKVLVVAKSSAKYNAAITTVTIKVKVK